MAPASVAHSGSFRPRDVSALSRFGIGSFRPVSFQPWVVSANLGGSFRLDFILTPRLRMIGRTIIWLFDEESSDVKDFFLKPSRFGVIEQSLIINCLFDEESVGIIGRGWLGISFLC